MILQKSFAAQKMINFVETMVYFHFQDSSMNKKELNLLEIYMFL